MRVVHCKKEAYSVYIGRPSPLGNPFMIGKHGSREEVIAKFEEYARSNAGVIAAILRLKDDDVLGCWCKPSACHGDVIVKMFNHFNRKG